MKGSTFRFWQSLTLALGMTTAGLLHDAKAEGRAPHNYRSYGPAYRYCPPSYSPSAPAPGQPPARVAPDGPPRPPAPGADSPGDVPPRTDLPPSDPGAVAQPPMDLFNQPQPDVGPQIGTFASAPAAAGSPNMKGDSLGGGCGTVRFEGVVVSEVNHPFFGCSRQKIAENNSPMPRDRVYFTYQHFRNAIFNTVTDDDPDPDLTDAQDTDVDKYLLGVERTLWTDKLSVQLQIPFANQLDTDMLLDFRTPPSAPGDTEVAFGNISVALKAVLLEDRCRRFLLSGGVMVELPTSSDVSIRALDITDFTDPLTGQDIPRELDFRMLFHNDSVILSPFLGALYRPNSRYFFQGFWQLDTDVSGSDLDFDPTVTSAGAPVPTVDRTFHFSGQTLMRFDLGGGVWLYRNRCARGLSGVAMLLEVHHSTTLDDADIFTIDTPGLPGGTIDFGNVANRIDITNLTLGPTFEISNRGLVGVGCVLPLSEGDNKPFDFEFQLQIDLLI
jgi:hypothetical protein